MEEGAMNAADGPAVLYWRTPSGDERARPLRRGDTLIGSAHDNDLFFPGPFVLRHHAIVRAEPDGYTLVNLAGAATRLNGQPPPRLEQPLQDGDILLLGDTRLYFRRAPAIPAPEPAGAAGSTRLYAASLEHLPHAFQALEAGEAVLGPYDSTYLLYAHLDRPQAVDAIFRAKGRPADKPLTVVAQPEDMHRLADIPSEYRSLIDAWFPGPVTLIFPKRALVPDPVTRGLPTVGLTFGRHPWVQFVAMRYPVCGTSANLSGRPAPQSIADALAQLEGRVKLGFDGGPTFYGESNTVVDLSGPRPALVRRAAGWERVVERFPELEAQAARVVGND
jgi:tRNA threonylcarbamoyl adenosine modification protein (Sua5/YciO/YrdC/YwlC family)